ncbi:MAG: hypothetical protein AABZ55_06560 [Bdellovibrionota bacterium]
MDKSQAPSTEDGNQARLTSFESEKGLIVWIDVLGTSKMKSTHDMKGLTLFLSAIASIVSGIIEKPTKRKPNLPNAIVVGDAICIAQSADNMEARESVVSSAIAVSTSLFGHGLSHRGVIVEGGVSCGPAYSSTPTFEYITGLGVLEAVKAERELKVVGLKIDGKLNSEIEKWKNTYTKEAFFTLSGGCFS